MRYLGKEIDYINVLKKVVVVVNYKTINMKIEGS
jgi:hypothetical protein